MIITVNRHVVARNRKLPYAEREPIFRVSVTKRSAAREYRTGRIALPAGSVLVYDPDNPLACGATVWIETP